MNMTFLISPGGLRLMALSLACATVPAAAASGAATVIFFGPGEPAYCKGHSGPALRVVERDGYRSATIPAGEPIRISNTINANVDSPMYARRYLQCVLGIAFTPAPGAVYYINSLARNDCRVEIARQDLQRETGLAAESNAHSIDCNQK